MELNSLAPTKPMVIFRLALLCKATQHLTAEMHQMVREYLIIRLGVISPMVDALMWQSVREQGCFDFVVSGSIPPEHRTTGPDRARNIRCEKAATAGDEHIVVHVRLNEWIATGDTLTYTLPWMMHVGEYQVTTLMEAARRQIDKRDNGYRADIEAPWTRRQWQTFCQLWLFGPSMPMQST